MAGSGAMDDIAFGRLIRLARIRLGWRQEDLAAKAGVSRTVVSRIERGHVKDLDAVRQVAAVLDIRVELVPRSRAINIDRVANARHSALAEFLVRWLGSFPGWVVRAEVSYSEFGERGVVDLLCWHAGSRSLLVVEIKTELLEFGELLAKLDQKGRLARRIARGLGWEPLVVSRCLLVADSTTNRRRATAHRALLGSVLPDDARALVRWLKSPVGAVHAIRFAPDVRPGHVRSGFTSPTRVRTRPATTRTRGSRSSRRAGLAA
jgi:transcriptional regulator with XRE-family HTH domain